MFQLSPTGPDYVWDQFNQLYRNCDGKLVKQSDPFYEQYLRCVQGYPYVPQGELSKAPAKPPETRAASETPQSGAGQTSAVNVSVCPPAPDKGGGPSAGRGSAAAIPTPKAEPSIGQASLSSSGRRANQQQAPVLDPMVGKLIVPQFKEVGPGGGGGAEGSGGGMVFTAATVNSLSKRMSKISAKEVKKGTPLLVVRHRLPAEEGEEAGSREGGGGKQDGRKTGDSLRLFRLQEVVTSSEASSARTSTETTSYTSETASSELTEEDRRRSQYGKKRRHRNRHDRSRRRTRQGKRSSKARGSRRHRAPSESSDEYDYDDEYDDDSYDDDDYDSESSSSSSSSSSATRRKNSRRRSRGKTRNSGAARDSRRRTKSSAGTTSWTTISSRDAAAAAVAAYGSGETAEQKKEKKEKRNRVRYSTQLPSSAIEYCDSIMNANTGSGSVSNQNCSDRISTKSGSDAPKSVLTKRKSPAPQISRNCQNVVRLSKGPARAETTNKRQAHPPPSSSSAELEEDQGNRRAGREDHESQDETDGPEPPYNEIEGQEAYYPTGDGDCLELSEDPSDRECYETSGQFDDVSMSREATTYDATEDPTESDSDYDDDQSEEEKIAHDEREYDGGSNFYAEDLSEEEEEAEEVDDENQTIIDRGKMDNRGDSNATADRVSSGERVNKNNSADFVEIKAKAIAFPNGRYEIVDVDVVPIRSLLDQQQEQEHQRPLSVGSRCKVCSRRRRRRRRLRQRSRAKSLKRRGADDDAATADDDGGRERRETEVSPAAAAGNWATTTVAYDRSQNNSVVNELLRYHRAADYEEDLETICDCGMEDEEEDEEDEEERATSSERSNSSRRETQSPRPVSSPSEAVSLSSIRYHRSSGVDFRPDPFTCERSQQTEIDSEQTHLVKYAQFIYTLYQKDQLTDVVLKAEIECFHVHRSVLACHSLYFADIFLQKYGSVASSYLSAAPPSIPDVIEINDISPTILRKILEYMYTGYVVLHQSFLVDILRAASKLRITQLQAKCIDKMDALQPIELLDFLMSVYNEGVEATNTDFDRQWHRVAYHFKRISHSRQFLQMNVDCICRLLGDDDLILASEFDVAEAAIRWINEDRRQRVPCAGRVLSCVRFKNLTPDELVLFGQLENYILDDPIVKDSILEANWYHTMCNARRTMDASPVPFPNQNPHSTDPSQEACHKADVASCCEYPMIDWQR